MRPSDTLRIWMKRWGTLDEDMQQRFLARREVEALRRYSKYAVGMAIHRERKLVDIVAAARDYEYRSLNREPSGANEGALPAAKQSSSRRPRFRDPKKDSIVNNPRFRDSSVAAPERAFCAGVAEFVCRHPREPGGTGRCVVRDDRIHRVVSDDGTEIAGRLRRQGPPLVIVHGGLGDGNAHPSATKCPGTDSPSAG
jgi:hypothetical protein